MEAASLESIPRRIRPLPIQVGSVDVVLLAADVNMLVDSIGALVDGMRRSHPEAGRHGMEETLTRQIAELKELQEGLASASGSLAEPPFELTPRQTRLLRNVLGDIAGYQRGELTAGLHELRRILSEL